MIEYRAFLETLKNYRLNTEQESRLKGAVRAFAYAEEFTCYPPTLFMILGKILPYYMNACEIDIFYPESN